MKRILLIRTMNAVHAHPPGTNGSASIRIPGMYATSRRQFLQRATSAAAFVAMARPDIAARVADASRAVAGRTPEEIAADEDFWRQIQEAFTLDRTLINLNNGGVCPSPRAVHEALKRYLDISNQAPAYHMWQVLEPNIESVRERLASEFGCDTEELAITRNASEALQIAQLGLDLAPGDEVVTTNQDYGRMLDTWQQRVRRDRIVLKQVSFPVPPPSQADLAKRLEAAITPRTKVLHFCHITNLTGQIFPVGDICRMARARGITTIVDGAHAFAHFPFKLADLGCDYYGTSLHKWLLARSARVSCVRRSGSRSTGRSRQPESKAGTSASSRDRHASGGHATRSPGPQFHRDRRRSDARLRYLRVRVVPRGRARRFSRLRSRSQARSGFSLGAWIHAPGRRSCGASTGSSRRQSSTRSSRGCA